MFKFLKGLMPKAQEFVINGSKDVQPTKAVATAGMTVNTTYAMRLSAVYACVRLISQTIGTLPFRVYEELPDGNRRIAKDYPLDKIINRKPNAESTASLFWGSVVSAILLRGGAHVRILKLGEKIVGLSFLNPDRLSNPVKVNGVKTWYYTEIDFTITTLTDKNVVYFPGFSIDGVCGISAIEYGASVFGNAMAANAAANSSFENGLQPTIYLKSPHVVNEGQRDKFRESMTKVIGAINAGTPVVLEGGQDVGTIGINQKDAQLLESRQFSIEEICRWFGVSPHMIGHSSTSVWGAGFEQQMIGTLTFTFAPHLTSIAQTINCFVIPPKDQERYYAEHVTQGLMRADSTARAAYYSQMVNNGMMTRAEVRRLENLDNKGGKSDVLTVQLALTPLDNLGEQPNAQAV